MRVYSAAEVHAALPWGPLANAIEAAFVATGAAAPTVPLRHAHVLTGAGVTSASGAGQDSLLLMPA